MARFTAPLTRTASTTLMVGNVYEPASLMRRIFIVDFVFGSVATPADAAFQFDLTRTTTVGTIGSSVTPAPKDTADAAATSLAAQGHTADGTLGAVLYSFPLNQRATMRWMPFDADSRIVIPATANNGLAVRTPTATSLVTVNATLEFQE
jgi:hypothetical protein